MLIFSVGRQLLIRVNGPFHLNNSINENRIKQVYSIKIQQSAQLLKHYREKHVCLFHTHKHSIHKITVFNFDYSFNVTIQFYEPYHREK